MDNIKLACLILFSFMTFSGCILSVSPDTSSVVVLDPGQEQTFTIKLGRDPGLDQGFVLYDESEGGMFSDPEMKKLGYTIDQDTRVSSASYTPDENSPGIYKLKFALKGWSESPPMGEAYIDMMNASYSRTWKIMVRGVAVSPKRDLVNPAGTLTTFTAKAYPEGEYEYQWFIDGIDQGTGENFDYTPDALQSGVHTLTVTARFGETEYNCSRHIIVLMSDNGGRRDTNGKCLKATSDGGFIVAGNSSSNDIPNLVNHGYSDVYIAKYDSSGAIEWEKLYGGSGFDRAASVWPLENGGYIVGGDSGSDDIPGLISTSSCDAYILKLDDAGDIEWHYLYDSGLKGSNSQWTYSVQPVFDGSGYIAVGHTIIRLDENGGLVWENRNFRGSSASTTQDNGFVILGERIQNNIPTVFKLDAGGNVIWCQTFDGNYRTPNGALISDKNGGYTLVRNTNVIYQYRSVLTRISEDGSILWRTITETDQYPEATMFTYLNQKEDGGYWMAGHRADDQIVVWKTDADGVSQPEGPVSIGGIYEEHQLHGGDITPDGFYLIIDNSYLPYPLSIEQMYILKLGKNNLP